MLKTAEHKQGMGKQKVNRNDLQHMADRLGGIYSPSPSSSEEIMEGYFSYRHHFGGLSVHVSRATELKNTSNLVEIPPCLSFNILFEGKINFALANNQYQLGATGNEDVECSAIVVSQPEVFTRHMKKDMSICKVNVFVERQWLEARCKNQEDVNLLNKIFQDKSTFLSWKASKETITLAKKLFKKTTNETLYDKLNDEILTIRLLSQCMCELELQTIKKRKFSQPKSHLQSHTQIQLKQRIDAQLSQRHSLQEIASSQGLSISTLQRKFKKAYGMTVSVYCTQRRLELAKKSLMLEGLSIGEAAYQSGYSHSSNFIAAFKKRFLITPAALVRSYQRQRSY